MDLELLRAELRKLLKDKLVPRVEQCDRDGEFPREAYNAVADAGYAAVSLPEDLGGGGLGLDASCAVMEEMSRVSPGFALSTFASFQLYGYNVSRLGTKEQKERFLGPVIRERKIGCWALTEPDIGSDAVHIKTTAKKEGAHWVLNGSKTFITNAPVADFFFVIAKSGGDGFDSASAFVLEKGMKGLEVSKPFEKHGHRMSPTGQVFLEQVRAPESHLIGNPNKAFYDMKHSLDIERFLVGPMATGMLEALIDRCVVYAYQRRQFDQPILSYQMIQEKIARMRMHLEIMRAAVNEGCRLHAAGLPIKTLATAMKLYGARAIVEMGHEAMQVLGGNGYMHEYGVEMFARDAKLFEIGGGTSEMMLQILAKDTIKEVGRRHGVL